MSFLDERVPGWRERINTETLELSQDCDCVAGQLNGSFDIFQELHGLNVAQSEQLGFYVKWRGPAHDYRPTSERYAALTEAWKRALA
jgi:hypothetical protein